MMMMMMWFWFGIREEEEAAAGSERGFRERESMSEMTVFFSFVQTTDMGA